ncbi:MAG: tetratricopeptide repeat protein, partial [Leptospiraceae bacterium]|nr:tetratricopeptide repeat protein [Leptospiraceae bacterium]
MIYFDKDWNVTTDKNQIYYYRVIKYKDGKPVGKVKDYYAHSGKLQFEGEMLDDTPKQEIPKGLCKWYRETGVIEQKAWFNDKGELIKAVFYDEKGKPLPPEKPTTTDQNLSTTEEESEWKKLNKQGMELYETGKYAEATKVFEQALKQAEKEFGKNHANYATSCNNLASLYDDQGRYAEAEPLYKEALAIRARVLGKDHPNYATSCDNLAVLYYNQGRYSEAEPLFKEALAIRAKVLGKDHPDYATSCNNLAFLYERQGRFAEAEPLYKEALAIREKVLGKDHPDFALSCNNLASLYDDQGRYSEAELLYKEALSIRAKVLGKDHPHYANSCNNLAELYRNQGRYAEAEPLYKEAKEIWGRVLGKDHPHYANSCNNLAGLYTGQGRFAEAEPLYKEAKKIFGKVFGKDHPDYATSCDNLASLYDDQGRYSEAEPLYKEALAIREKVLGKDHPDFALSCNNLASLYDDQGRYSEAEPLYKDALAIRAKVFGKAHPDYALSCNNLAVLYKNQGRYSEAEPLYKEALAIREKVLGKDHPHYALSCNNLAGLYEGLSRYSEAEPLYKEASQTLISNIQRNFIGLSEKEKEQYLATFKFAFEYYFSFALKAQKPELSAWLLENNLITKGLLFYSTNQLRRTLEKSQDKSLKETYEKWLAQRKAVSQAYEMGEQKRKEKNINLQALEKEANETEKQLSLLLSKAGISAELTPKPRKWQEIQAKLQPNEALVEMTRIKYFDKKWTDSVLYVALVVRKESKFPEMVVLPNGNILEKKYTAYYRNMVRLRKQDKQSYAMFFEPIAQKLGGIQKVYFSGDGLYHQINLSTLYNPTTNRYLGEELNIQLISTARDFLELGKKQLQKQTQAYKMYLFGYPDFAGKSQRVAKQGESRGVVEEAVVSQIDKRQRFFDELSGEVSYLPGTQKEIATIEALAKQVNMRVEVHLSERASEENLKGVVSPTFLHIATHGFFVESKEEGRGERGGLLGNASSYENPLLKAGLLLANAEKTLKREAVGSQENGILTAQEAMNLDLHGTDLVVLSACETGLGEIKNGEGVFGLQRALQEAGARSVLMSLWKVDDTATQEMMTLFYEN